MPRRRNSKRTRLKVSGYELRTIALASLGFASYSEYLSSQTWKSIRAKVLENSRSRCFACNGFVTQVHHRSYTVDVLKGTNLSAMIATCGNCHKRAEYQGTVKVSLQTANKRFNSMRKHNALPAKSAPATKHLDRTPWGDVDTSFKNRLDRD